MFTSYRSSVSASQQCRLHDLCAHQRVHVLIRKFQHSAQRHRKIISQGVALEDLPCDRIRYASPCQHMQT